MPSTVISLALALLAGPQESGAAPGAAETVAPTPGLAPGPWRAVLESPGGELPFGLLVGDDGEVQVLNGRERIPVPAVLIEDGGVVFEFPHYDSRITATLSTDGKLLAGTWTKRHHDGWTRMAFRATWGDAARFLPLEGLAPADPSSIAGTWKVEFSSTSASAVGRFAPQASATSGAQGSAGNAAGGIEGTFLTTTGDYRYLAGALEGNVLRLSCFDGAHAFLFRAELDDEGRLAGDFWSRDSWHETWTARPDPDAALPDAFELTHWRPGASLADAVFPDLDGTLHSLAEYAVDSRGLVVQLFGSWCPNCHDETAFLTDLHRRYRARGLRVVGLAFELTGEVERDTLQVRRFAERYNVEYPLLLGGVADKSLASESFPGLDAVRSFPTTLFFHSDGRLRAVHQGFTGPATGPAYDTVRGEFEALAEELVTEDAASSGADLTLYLMASSWVAADGGSLRFGPGPLPEAPPATDGSPEAGGAGEPDATGEPEAEPGFYAWTPGEDPLPVRIFGDALFWGDEVWRVDREASALLSPLDAGRRWVPAGAAPSPLIATLGLDYWDGYLKAAVDRSPIVRREAIHARVRSARVAAVAGSHQLSLVGFRELSTLLEDPDMGVRVMAAWAAGELGEMSTLEALERAAESPNPALRREAKRALERLRL